MKNKNYLNKIIFAVIIFGIVYLIIWLIFVINGPFKIGDDLKKSDWLIFLGGYLSFVGTISVSYLVIVQNKKYHETEQEKLRYSQLPYIKIKLADKSKLIPDSHGNYLLDYPSMVFDNGKFVWKGSNTGGMRVLIRKDQIDRLPVYGIQNIGLGHAMKISLNTSESEYSYRNHLKIEETLYFIIDVASLERKSQKSIFFVKFCDIYNNQYQQKLSCEFNIIDTEFDFTLSQDQFEPELLT